MLAEQPDLVSSWHAIRDVLRRRLGETIFQAWIARVHAEAWDGELLLLSAPSEIQDWVATRFGPQIEACAREVRGPQARIAFNRNRSRNLSSATPADPPPRPERTLNPRYTFEQFIIGRGNHLAHAAALAVAENPGQAYNPLFLHAPPGLGKTHLLHAIGNYVLAFGGGAVVRYTTAETFTNHFLGSLGSRTTEAFKRAYRDADVLLIDDVQFLASKAKTEEEFFHTFNALYENGRQLVLTSDRMPGTLTALQDRLRERFEAGLVTEIQPPDYPTRLAFLRKRAQIDGLQIADSSVLELIAGRVTTNVRLLEGALIRIVALHSLIQRPIDVSLATEVLDELHPEPDPAPQTCSIPAIQKLVAARCQVALEEMLSEKRAARLAWPRQLAIYLARELTGAAWEQLGEAFGGRSHSTAMHAWRKVSTRMAEDPAVIDEISTLTRLLRDA